MKKRIAAIALALAMVMGPAVLAAGGSRTITITPMEMEVNGQKVSPTASNGATGEAFSHNGVTYAPVRYLCELLGIDVTWDRNDPNTVKLSNVPSHTGGAALTEDGTFTAGVQGFAGPVTVWVTVKDGAIADVQAQGPQETPGKGSVAIDQLPARIVAAGSTEVEGISGATVTSDALKAAVNEALAGKVKGTAPSLAQSVSYKPGTYTAKAFGFHSYVTVETTFTDDAIQKVTVTDNSGETPYLRDLCAESIPAQIVENQSLNVDVVTGATWGSEAIINAVADCVSQAAGADAVTVLKAVKPAAPTPKDETYDGYDLCVVGGGGSGTIAAAVASQTGLKVIVIEAADRFGGVSEIAGGGTLAIGTELQKNALQKDGSVKDLYEAAGETAEQVYDRFVDEYLNSTHYQASRLLVKSFLTASGKAADFLAGLGMPISAASVNTVRYGSQGTRFGTLMDVLEQNGVTALLSTRGERLITDGKGTVTGVIAANATGGTTTIHAKTVLLATGGMSNNTAMMEQYAHDYNEKYMNWGSSTANGDGVRMAWDIGAMEGRVGTQSHNEGLPLELHSLFDMDITTGNCLYANLAYEPMLRLNPLTGRRISDEGVIYTPHYHGNVSMMSAGAMVILDQATMDSLMENGSQTRPWRSKLYADPMKDPDYTGLNLQQQVDQVIEAGYAYRADTLDALAGQLGVDAGVLKNEVAKYNAAVKNGVDPEYDRDPESLVYSIEQGPFYALETKVRNLGTFGGLVTDETLAVYHRDGSLIPGLYAAGYDALSWVGTDYFVDTTTLGWMTASGYMAGNSVVDYVATVK